MASSSDARVSEPLLGDAEQVARAGTVLDGAADTPTSSRVASSATLVDPLVGQVVSDRYRVDALLGAGGMGCVYQATHVHMRNVVALKVLHRQMNMIPEAVARFEREAIAAARIQHKNVAAARDFGRLEDGSFYMALEFVEGTTLRELLSEVGALPIPRTVNILRQIAEALNAAHAKNVVHRDLKPDNVMLLDDGTDFVKVLDFGIAKVSGSNADGSQLTQLGSVFGTPDYMSPEQAAGQPVDHRSDLYALGVLMYEMLTGGPPFSGDSIAIVLSKHMHEPAPDLPERVDWRLADLTKRLLAKDPSERPASARVVVDELVRTRLSVVPVPPRSRKWLARADKVRRVARVVGTTLQPLLAPVGRMMKSGWQRLLLILAKACDRVTQRFPRLGFLDRKFALGSYHFSLWALLGAACIGCVAVAVVWAWSTGDEVRVSAAGDENAKSNQLDPARGEESPAGAIDSAPSAELQDLLDVPVYKRKVGDWLMLGKLHRDRKEWTESTAAYRNAIQLDRKVAGNAELLQAMRDAAEHHASHAAAINVAVNLLGEPGLDLVYDLWLSTKNERSKREIAEVAYKKLEILRLRRASDALRVRLDLEFLGNGECEPIADTVERAIRHADERSVDALSALEQTSGCGSSKRRDCYPCLRADDNLKVALEQARRTKAPRFDGTRFVPAP